MRPKEFGVEVVSRVPELRTELPKMQGNDTS